MSCFCSKSALALQAGMQIPPISFSLPSGIAELSANLAATGSAQAGASAGASAMAQLQAAVGVSATAKLALMASLCSSGIFPGGIPTLPSLILSLNANLPSLSATLQMGAPGLLDLGLLAGFVVQLNAMGINPMSASAAADLQATLAASAGASATATASASASASMDAEMSAAAAAGLSMGLPMGLPDPVASLGGFVSALASLDIPPLTVSAGFGCQLMATLNAVAQIQAAFGVNFQSAASMQAMMNAVATMNLQALASVSVEASASAQGSATAAGSGEFAARMDAALAPLSLGMLGNLGLAASISATLAAAGAAVSVSPCGSCSFMS